MEKIKTAAINFLRNIILLCIQPQMNLLNDTINQMEDNNKQWDEGTTKTINSIAIRLNAVEAKEDQSVDYRKLANEIDVGEIAECFDNDDIAGELRLDEIADEISARDIAKHMDVSEVANELDIDDITNEIANSIDTDDVAQYIMDNQMDELADRICTDFEPDYKKLCVAMLRELQVQATTNNPVKQETQATC